MAPYRNSFRCFTYRNLAVVNCVALLLNSFLLVFNVNFRLPTEVSFLPSMEAKDRDLLDRTLRAFVKGVEGANVSYFMTGGTLIGSLRHHGRIPWDDDVDFIVDVRDKPKLQDSLSRFSPDFELLAKKPPSISMPWKFYPTNGRKLEDHPEYRTPFIDIWFYAVNATHVWNISPTYRRTEVWVKRSVFPLIKRPFEGLYLPAPCDSLNVTSANTNISMCVSLSYDHLFERNIPGSVMIPCERLSHIFPFVRRNVRENESTTVVHETLVFSKWLIKEVTLQKLC